MDLSGFSEFNLLGSSLTPIYQFIRNLSLSEKQSVSQIAEHGLKIVKIGHTNSTLVSECSQNLLCIRGWNSFRFNSIDRFQDW